MHRVDSSKSRVLKSPFLPQNVSHVSVRYSYLISQSQHTTVIGTDIDLRSIAIYLASEPDGEGTVSYDFLMSGHPTIMHKIPIIRSGISEAEIRTNQAPVMLNAQRILSGSRSSSSLKVQIQDHPKRMLAK